MKCIEYNAYNDIWVEFQDKGKAKVHTTWWCFSKGNIKNPRKKVGMIGTNKVGYQMEIVDYIDCSNIYVRFIGYNTITHTNFRDFKEGNVKNWDAPTVYGHGIIGNMRNRVSSFGKTKEYSAWCGMLERCYNPENFKKRPTYDACEVCEDWMYFENFYDWIHSQDNCEQWLLLKRSAIDKDIIKKHNKIYSPETCCLVPQNVNALFIRQESTRGYCPIGVYYNSEIDSYVAQLAGLGTKTKYFESFDTPEEAFQYYKEKKEMKIKKIAKKSMLKEI